MGYKSKSFGYKNASSSVMIRETFLFITLIYEIKKRKSKDCD